MKIQSTFLKINYRIVYNKRGSDVLPAPTPCLAADARIPSFCRIKLVPIKKLELTARPRPIQKSVCCCSDDSV